MSSLIPKPKKESYDGQFLNVDEAFCIVNESFDGIIEKAFYQRIQKSMDGTKVNVHRNDNLSAEGYRLIINKSAVEIEASSENGAIYGLCSLRLLMDNKGNIPCGQIEDEPIYKHRGLHLDCARHFFSKSEIKKILDEMYTVKLNRFHWHLSDDQGWRIELDKYPELVRQCGNEYYTKDDIKDIVVYAHERGIEVIPEIDMPGHTRSLTSAFPKLSCFEEKVQLAKFGGIYPVILCPGKEDTFTFLKNMLDEIVPLFPGKYFHMGGDEAPKKKWKECLYCQKRIKEEGLKDEAELQGYFSKRIGDYLKDQYQKIVICWNDSLEAADFLTGDEIIQYWTLDHRSNMDVFLDKGGQFIYSDMFDIYYDYPAAMSPMRRSYSFTPIIGGTDYGNDKRLLGYEACVWTEHITTDENLERRIFPRIYALAEKAWSNPNEDNYKDFKLRLKKYKKITGVIWGNSDPRGIKKALEKLRFIKSLSSAMPEEIRNETIDAAKTSDEFMKVFSEKMLK